MLNARYHEQEAHIIAQAGMPGTVTIATNMAGRGTDIQLGGNPRYRIRDWINEEIAAGRGAGGQLDEIYFEWVDHCLSEFSKTRPRANGASRRDVQEWIGTELKARVAKGAVSAEEAEAAKDKMIEKCLEIETKLAEIVADVGDRKKKALDAGGLYVIGTERHESRRIDNQLRGRSGRQGDPGRSKFYLSLEDDLMRIFGSDRMDGMLQKLGLQDGEAITHPWINKALEKAQQKVEARNFDSRKYVLKYDDVMNDQRKVIFEHRIDIMGHDDVSETVKELRHEVITGLVSQHIPENAYAEQWNTEDMKSEVQRIFGLDLPIDKWAAEEGIADQEITERLTKEVDDKARAKEAEFGSETMRQIEKMVLLQTLDHLWREHLVTLEHLRQVIGFRSYGQRDPLNEYKSEGFHLFETMLANLREAVTGQLMHIQGMPRGGARDAGGGAATHARPSRRSVHGRGRARHGRRGAEPAGPTARPSGARLCRRAEAAGARSTRMIRPRGAKWRATRRVPCGSGKKYKHCHGRHD